MLFRDSLKVIGQNVCFHIISKFELNVEFSFELKPFFMKMKYLAKEDLSLKLWSRKYRRPKLNSYFIAHCSHHSEKVSVKSKPSCGELVE